MFHGKIHKQLSLVGELLMTSNPYWFYHQVVFFENDVPVKKEDDIISFYEIFTDQLDIKLYEEQIDESLSSSCACFFFKS